MVSLSFSSFMLVMLLFIFLTIKDTIAHTDDQAKQIVHEAENYNASDLKSYLSVKKQVLESVPAAAEFRLGGRKMMIEIKKDMKEVKKGESSGNYNRPLGHDSRKNLHYQGNDSDSMNSASTHNSKNDDQSDDNGSFQKIESEKFVDDTTELFTMMNKDYVGGPGSGSKPRHKPPINNFQPLHRSNP
ncbi:uncharacterized protein LOC107014007 isoform X2 [Solanum pennellii]|uniref:Uncharacterized protein LOC107014007 isoform X2 n=1 Tax=Solanum pennellii TaxID=28526 RepID=A0ABM1GD00_SOLPN|nr:uncharacterized protein LOC107014007 isoform X2 [Solanum pennellii]